MDLTRIYNFESVVIKHYVDSALVTKLVELPSELLDLGTGPGFPGIPIKIMRPDLRLTLMDTDKERIGFLKEAVSVLGLSGVEIVKKKLSGPIGKRFGGIITRALEDINSTLKRILHVVEPGGLVIFMKGPSCDEEIQEAKNSMGGFFSLLRDIHYTIPNTPHKRRLVIFQRIMEHFRDHKKIQSEENKHFKLFRSLLSSRGIEKNGIFLMSGQKVVLEVVQRYKTWVEGVIIKEGGPFPDYVDIDRPIYELSKELFRELDVFNRNHPILLIRCPELMDLSRFSPKGSSLAIPFQDPGNVGAVIRTAVAMGFKKLVLLDSAASPFHPKAVAASGPCVLEAQFFGKATFEEISTLGIPLVGLTPPPRGRDLFEFHFPEDFILVPGLEGPGLPHEVSYHLLSIPMEPHVESLNAAMATGIVLFWLKYKDRLRGLPAVLQGKGQGA